MNPRRSLLALVAWIAARYLMGARRSRVPTAITLISIFGVAAGVATLIVVLAVLGGFEADLRDKILSTKAHLRVTGPSEDALNDPAKVLEHLDAHPEVVGLSPFVESELLLASVTNYSGAVVRGVDLGRLATTSTLQDEIIAGQLAWLEDPDRARPPTPPTASERRWMREHREGVRDRLRDVLPAWSHGLLVASESAESTGDDLRDLREELDRLLEETRRTRDFLEAEVAEARTERERDFASELEAFRNEVRDPPSEAPAETAPPDEVGFEMPALPLPGQSLGSAEAGAGAEEGVGMPSLPTPRAQVPTAGTVEQVPGVVIGSQLQAMLRVEIGEVVQLISPDGDLSPAGPIPRSRPFRVVAVFHTGLYEFDQAYAFTRIDALRDFLSLGPTEVTAVEARVRRMDRAALVAQQLRDTWAQRAADEIQIKDWQEMNSTLFAALMLEKVVMFLILSIIMLVASFAIVCMLTVIVIEKGREIAVMKAMGASRGTILKVFLAEGGMVGALGTTLGAIVGLGVVAYLAQIGFPLDPEVFYIDRLPVRIAPMEVAAVLLASVTISLLATLYPSMQAAGLDPVAGLRTE